MKFITDVLKGVIIGVANAIPGVSGGTMMVSMGVFDDIIYCITHLFKQVKQSIMTLLPYFIGMALGVVGLAYAIQWLYANYPFQTNMLFIGLIFGGLPMIWKEVKAEKTGVPQFILFLLFFAAIIAMQYFGNDGTSAELTISFLALLKMFFIGIVASATMVIPGVSGSMMLQILGYYYPIMDAITTFVSGVKNGDWAAVLHVSVSLVPFGIGVVLGIFVIAKIIEILLQKWKSHTYSAILGLVVSSPVVILMGTAFGSIGLVTILTGAVTLFAGVFIASLLGK